MQKSRTQNSEDGTQKPEFRSRNSEGERSARRVAALPRLLLAVLAVLFSCQIRAESDAERAAKSGALYTLKNHRVLRLYGKDAKQRGFAHGYLLAEVIRDDLGVALQTLPNFSITKYEKTLLPWGRKHFEWDADAAAEMDGIFAGMAAKLGKDGLMSEALGRALTRDDIVGINVLAD